MESLSVQPQDRPTLLTVLCILSFIGSGFGVLANLTAVITVPLLDFFQPSTFNATFSQLGNNTGDEFIKQALDMALLVMDNFLAIVLSKFILYVLSLVGAIMMFQMKKIGFYLYIIAQVGFLFIGPILLGWNIIVGSAMFFSAFFSVLFVALYSINLKYMS